jgi:hypothetical protein
VKPQTIQNDEKPLGDRMNETQLQKPDFGAIAWGASFIWWGITELFPSLPAGTGALGIGLILLGLNAARYYSGVPTSRFSTTVGILSLVWGGLELAGLFLNLPFEIPVFAILLVVLGMMVLAPEFTKSRNETIGGL